ncbi:MAG: pilus assembly protein [Anaerolineales bacterium]|nr:pilus assembly protein [Anaerolineales bacterium]
MNLHTRNSQRGQGTLEFALIIPIVLLVVFAVFEGARAIFVYQSVITASREAARFGSSVQNYLNCTAIRNEALRFSRPAQTTASDIRIYYLISGDSLASVDNAYKNAKACGVWSGPVETEDRIVVEVTGYFDPARAMPLMSFPQMTFSSTTRRTILKEIELGWELQPGTNLASIFEAWLP